jgi:predicted permease
VLVAAEVAVAVVLVTGAMLFARSVSRLYAADVGLEARGVGAVDLVVPGPAEMSDEEVEAFYLAALEQVRALPGVSNAGRTLRLPLRGDGIQGSMAVEDRSDLVDAQTPSAYWRPVTTGYFATLGIELLEGRSFDDGDRPGAPQVAIVSARLAREMWSGESALGRRVRHSGFETEWATVVGVVEDVPVSDVRAGTPSVMYRPDAQRTLPWRGSTIVFRGDGDPALLLGPVQDALRRADPRVAPIAALTMDEVLADSIGDVLQLRLFFGLLAALALALGCVGVYGIVSYSVSRNTAEYGVRMALGADARRLVAAVLVEELTPVVLGTAVGVASALLAARAASRLLWEVHPGDPLSLAVAGASLLLCGVLAALGPAVRASALDPSSAFRR